MTLDLGSATLSGRFGNDNVVITGASGAFSDRNAGSGKTVSITGVALGGPDAGNYVLAGSVASTVADIFRAPVTLAGVTAAGKVYDGTTAVTLDLASARLVGVIGQDAVTLGSATGAFGDKNAGAGKSVVVSGLTLGGADAGNYTVATNSVVTTADITPATISSVSGIGVAARSYDGTTNASLTTSGATFAGRLAGDQLTVAAAVGAYADRNAGTGKAVSITGITLGGADARNYLLASTTASAVGDINPATLTLSGFTVASRVYDATTNATVTSPGVLSGLVAGETLNFAITAAAFADKNAGTGKTATITAFSLTNGTGLASNYRFDPAGSTASASITPATISRVTGITARNRIFDGTTNVTLDTAGAVFVGRQGSDTLTVGAATGAFSDAELGLAKTVTITGIALGGADARNYTLAETTARTTADILSPPTSAAISAVTAVTPGDIPQVRNVPILGAGPRANVLRLTGPAPAEGSTTPDATPDAEPGRDRAAGTVCAPGERRDERGVCRAI